MEEALEILWTYARREPLDSNGETIVPTINNSIASIRIIMRLEGWAMGSEKRKGKPSENLELGYVGEKRATHNKPARGCRGEWQFAQTKFAQSQFAQSQFAQSQFAQSQYAQSQNTQHNTNNNTNNHNEGELPNMGELPFAPTPAQHHFAQTKFAEPDTTNNDNDDEYIEGELPFPPTYAQSQYPQPNISQNSYHTAGASLQLVP